MRILIDTREQAPYAFTGYEVGVEPATLRTGDYSIPGFEDRCAVERKSLGDLIGCLTTGRTRFEAELARSRPYELFVVVVEANMEDVYQGRYTSDMKPQSAMQSILAFMVRYRVPFLFCGNRAGGEYVVHGLLSKYLREIGERWKVSQNGQVERGKAA